MSAQPHRTLSSSLSLPSTAFDLAAFSARTSSCSSSSPPLVASVLDLIVISAAHYSLAVASYASSCFGQLAATRGASARLHCLATLLPACRSSCWSSLQPSPSRQLAATSAWPRLSSCSPTLATSVLRLVALSAARHHLLCKASAQPRVMLLAARHQLATASAWPARPFRCLPLLIKPPLSLVVLSAARHQLASSASPLARYSSLRHAARLRSPHHSAQFHSALSSSPSLFTAAFILAACQRCSPLLANSALILVA